MKELGILSHCLSLFHSDAACLLLFSLHVCSEYVFNASICVLGRLCFDICISSFIIQGGPAKVKPKK